MTENELRNTVRRLRDNDPTLTMLDLRDINGSRSYVFESGDDVFREMIDALSTNTTIRTVSIVLRFLHKLTTEEKVVMFRSIGSLPNLKELRIASMGFANLALKLVNELLVVAAKKENPLEALTLQSMQYRGKIYYDTMAGTNTDTTELKEFLESLKGLKDLRAFAFQDAQMTFDLNAVVLRGLASMRSLRRIAINSHEFPDDPRLSEGSLLALANLPKLEWLSLRRLHLGTILPSFLRAVTSHPRLEFLILHQNMMGAGCAIALGDLIQRNHVLKGVYLAYNMIPDHIGAAIADALSENTSIVEFDIAANEIGAFSCQAFARTLASPTSKLQFLNLSQHTLPADGIEQLATALRDNTELKSLALMEVQMSEDGGIAFANALMENATLERLNVSDNRLGNRSCVEFSNVLKANTTIKSLNLCSNRIRNEGAILLADALLVNSTLEQLNLVNNHSMGKVAYDAFEVMVQENTTIQHLWLPTVIPESTIPSYVRLNKLGRKQLLHEMENASKWLSAISACQNDLIALYCLIRANPNVVSWLQR